MTGGIYQFGPSFWTADEQRDGLMRAVFEDARVQDLPCYLSTSNERNVPFYLDLGFTKLSEIVEPSSGVSFWTFRRNREEP